jgi:hypothetical protein
MILYRPVGLPELRLVAASGWREWPPRLAHQPIFYPVLTIEYARTIAREWNTVDESSGFVGFVTRFTVDDAFIGRYPTQAVGGRAHEELWIPAADLGDLNRHLVGRIEVVEAHAGPRFVGVLDPETNLPVDFT